MNNIKAMMLDVLKCFAPPPRLTLSEWADQFRKLSSESSAEPGRWRTDRAPYQRGIMDAISDPEVERVTVMASSQVGKTEISSNTIGYFSHQDPSPILMIQPTLEMAETYSKDRLAPMIRDTEALTSVYGVGKSRTGNNTLTHKKFRGGQVTLAGSNSPSSLASRPIRVLILDEVDRYNKSAGEEGDPVSLAMKRTTTFHNRKIVAVSTPLIKNRSRIEDLYLVSDQRKYHVQCPHCRSWIVFEFKNFKWQGDDSSSVVYTCPDCTAIIDEASKFELLKHGKWIASKPFDGHAGFHLSEFYSPWRKWSEIVADFIEKKKNPETLKTFINTSLGETWEQKGDAPEWRRIYDRREKYKIGTVPMHGLFLTAAADVQKDRIECEIKAWGRGAENWSVDYRVLIGDTSEEHVWKKLGEILSESFDHESGQQLQVRMLGVDSGFNTQKVYEFVRRFPANRVLALKGQSGLHAMIGTPKGADISSKGKIIKNRGLRVWPVGIDLIKSDLYGLLRIDSPTEGELSISGGRYPGGYCHYPEYGEEYFRQLTAESLVERSHKGYTKYEWVKVYDRNESLDTHVYNRAIAHVIGIDRFKDKHWVELENSFSNFVGATKVESSATENFRVKPKKNVMVVKDESGLW